MKMNENLTFLMIITIVLFLVSLSCELALFTIFSQPNFASDTDLIGILIVLRILLALLFSTLLSLTISRWANKVRLKALRTKWLRSRDMIEKIPAHLLTLYDHLIQFGALARVKVVTETIQVTVFSFYLVSIISLQEGLFIIFLAVLGLLSLLSIKKVFSRISVEMAQAEQDIVSCGTLLVERGSSGWSNKDLEELLSNFDVISNKISRLYCVRLAVSQGMRSLLEFAVFILVGAGILLSSSEDLGLLFGSSSVSVILVLSRIAPISFSIFTNATTVGFGHKALKTYNSE